MANEFNILPQKRIGTEIYHYTTIDALNFIFPEFANKGKEICLLATDFEFLNDSQEVYLGTKVAAKYLAQVEEELKIDPDKRISDIVLQELVNIKETTLFKEIDHKTYNSMFITSFSKAFDNLSMWNMYSDNGNGIALEFNWSLVFFAYESLLRYVVYDNEEAKIIDIIKTFYQDIAKNSRNPTDTITRLARYVGMRIKDYNFSHEQEHRLCILGNTHQIGEQYKDNKIKFRVRKGVLIPYFEIFYPKIALQRVIVGPTRNFEQTYKAIRMLLNARGMHMIDIVESKVPYRG